MATLALLLSALPLLLALAVAALLPRKTIGKTSAHKARSHSKATLTRSMPTTRREHARTVEAAWRDAL